MVALSRRKLLQLSAFGVAAQMFPFQALNVFAQQVPGDYKALVCVFLFGGNDGDNMVVPMITPVPGQQDNRQAYDDYLAVRGGVLAHQSSDLLEIGDTPHNTYGLTKYGLHPGMTALHGLSSKLAVVANVGTLFEPMTKAEYQARSKQRPQSLFSHSNQQEQMQNASPIMPSASGWGGRAIDQVQGLNQMQIFPAGLSMSGNNVFLLGDETQPVSLGGGSSILLDDTGETLVGPLQQTLGLDTGFGLMQAANATLSQGIGVGQAITQALANSTVQTQFPNTSLGRQLRQVAQLIEAGRNLGTGRQIFFCSTGGYDTHSNQLPRHASILTVLSDAMAAFYTATEELQVENNVTTFTESDFGRTFQPNPTQGTDHAWGSYQLVLGGEVWPGLYGTFPTLQVDGPDSTDSRGRWIPTTALDQYGSTLARWFGVEEQNMQDVFPNINNFPHSNVGFMDPPPLL